MEATVLWWS